MSDKFSFNRPILYISLLSEQALSEIQQKNNHPVYASTVMDEFVVRTPDDLMSGGSTKKLIQNCCPDIDSNSLLSCDIQHLLTAIKIATNGPKMDFNLKCNKCNQFDPYEIELLPTITNMSAKKWFEPIVLEEGITINCYPQSYDDYCQFAISEFKLNKQLHYISSSTFPEEYGNLLVVLLDKKRKLHLSYYVNCIKSLYLQEQEQIVDDHKYIEEWFYQCEIDIQKKILNHIDEANKLCSLSNIQTTCSKCNKEMIIPIDLDVCSNFRQKIIPASEDEILDIISLMGKECKEITNNLLHLIWHMRGSISYEEALHLTNEEQLCISKIIEENLEITKKLGTPYV